MPAPHSGVALRAEGDAGSEMLSLERNQWAVLGGGCEPGCWFSFWTLTNAAWRPREKSYVMLRLKAEFSF